MKIMGGLYLNSEINLSIVKFNVNELLLVCTGYNQLQYVVYDVASLTLRSMSSSEYQNDLEFKYDSLMRGGKEMENSVNSVGEDMNRGMFEKWMRMYRRKLHNFCGNVRLVVVG